MELFLFAGYLVLFAWLVTKVRFFTRSGLTAAQLVIVFLLKVMAGIFYGWVGVYYGDMAQMVDTWYYHYQSLPETNVLLSQPAQYFSSFFNTTDYSGFLGGEGSWWNELDIILILKLLGIFNAASFGHYYINVIFYSFITLFGPVALYRVFCDQFRGREMSVLLAVFFIPSFIYWTSGLHKEGLIFNGIALLTHAVYFGVKQKRLGVARIAVILFWTLALLVLRNYLVLLLLPALLAWGAAARLKGRPIAVYSLVYAAFAILFFAAPFISVNLDFPAAVVEKQRQFSQLSGNSEVAMQKLAPTVGSFLANVPQAINLSIIRPYPTDIRHLLSLAAAVEINALLLLFLLYLLLHLRSLRQNPFSLFCLFFSITVLLIIGYTVNFLGAIVRYRSIVLPLLFVPVLVKIPWQRIASLLFNIKTKNNVRNLPGN